MPRDRALAVLGLAAISGLAAGCMLLSLQSVVEEMGSQPEPADGVEFYSYEGQTKFGEHYRVRHFLQPATRHRYAVTYVDGKVFRAGSENVADEMAAAKRAYAGAWEAGSEQAVRTRFGAPKATTDAGEVQVWWYPGSDREVFALLFRGGQFLDAFRTTQEELTTLLAKPAPY